MSPVRKLKRYSETETSLAHTPDVTRIVCNRPVRPVTSSDRGSSDSYCAECFDDLLEEPSLVYVVSHGHASRACSVAHIELSVNYNAKAVRSKPKDAPSHRNCSIAHDITSYATGIDCKTKEHTKRVRIRIVPQINLPEHFCVRYDQFVSYA